MGLIAQHLSLSKTMIIVRTRCKNCKSHKIAPSVWAIYPIKLASRGLRAFADCSGDAWLEHMPHSKVFLPDLCKSKEILRCYLKQNKIRITFMNVKSWDYRLPSLKRGKFLRCVLRQHFKLWPWNYHKGQSPIQTAPVKLEWISN